MDRTEARDRVRQLVADLEYERGADPTPPEDAAAIIAALEAPPDHAPELSDVAGRPRILRLRGMFHTITVQETPSMLGAYLLSLRPSPSGWLSQADVRQIVTFLAGPARVLPDPAGGCSCTPHDQDAGGGYVEHLLEYDPACPEHSHHLYDPRTGSWLAVTEATAWGYRLPDGTEEWAQDHSDGTWTTQYQRDKIMLQTDTADSMVDLLRQLEGHDAVLIQRRVLTAEGPVQP